MSIKKDNNLIKIRNKIYEFPRLNYETNESFFLRKKFYTKISPSSEKEHLDTINMSIIWSNMKILGCVYPDEVVQRIENKISKTNM